MNDYQIVHFNGANRTPDAEITDATAIHPITDDCEYLSGFTANNIILFVLAELLLVIGY